MTRDRVEVDVTWHGEQILKRFNRAIARGTIATAERIVNAAKRGVHVITGDLRRSVHAARANSGGEQGANQQNVLTRTGAVVEAGSWLDYACVEESRGGSHAYMMPAVEAVRGTTYATFKAAFAEERLA